LGVSGGTSAGAAVPVATVSLYGSGFGHGVGLSQYGALGQAEAGRTAAQILGHYYTGTTLGPVADAAVVRVNLLHRASSAAFRTLPLTTGGGALQVIVNGAVVVGNSTDRWQLTPAATGVVARRTVGTKVTTYAPSPSVVVRWGGTQYLAGVATLLDLAGPGESTTDAAGRYRRGELEVRSVAGALEASALLRLHDEYLDGVAEVPSSWPVEALRAQAVASRTYALHTAAARGLSAACDCQLYDSTTDQVYAGWAKEDEAGGLGARWVSAVTSTAPSSTTGLAVLSGGQPIAAYYSSSTGGVTRSSASVWGGALPYAVSVDDHWSLRLDVNPMAAWTRTYTAAALRAAAFPSLPDLARFQLTSFATDGTLATATAWSSGGASATATGASLAAALGLPSRWVTSFVTTLAGSPPPAVDVTRVPGHHASGGREWQTWCEPYDPGVTRCWVSIVASHVVRTATGYAIVTGWQFNNLAYRGTWSAPWDTNPIAVPGDHTIGGRQWRITCTPAATGPRSCTGYIWATKTSATPAPGGGYTFRTYATWVYNHTIVLT
jgi:stage II sporulation protein D